MNSTEDLVKMAEIKFVIETGTMPDTPRIYPNMKKITVNTLSDGSGLYKEYSFFELNSWIKYLKKLDKNFLN